MKEGVPTTLLLIPKQQQQQQQQQQKQQQQHTLKCKNSNNLNDKQIIWNIKSLKLETNASESDINIVISFGFASYLGAR